MSKRNLLILGAGLVILAAVVIVIALSIAPDTSSVSIDAEALSSLDPTAEALAIAGLPVVITTDFGDALGSGTVRLYVPDQVEPGASFELELELHFDRLFVTATPPGAPTISAPTPVTEPRPTAVPRTPFYDEADVEFYPEMGASLLCPDVFEGCDTQRIVAENVQLISRTGASWRWSLATVPDASGVRELRLELWTETGDTVWWHEFLITIGSAPRRNLDILVVGVLVIIGVFVALGAYLMNRPIPKRKGLTDDTVPLKPVRPRVFVSYNHIANRQTARTLYDTLNARGAEVFVDTENVNKERFESTLKKAIDSSDYFVLVLAEDAFESEWVIKETIYALTKGKRIIPVQTDAFDPNENELPAGFEVIKWSNTIKLQGDYFESGIGRIAKLMGLSD
jgi:hypothetical protein